MSEAGVEHLKDTIRILSGIPAAFSTQASTCEGIYKNQTELRKLIQDKSGKNEPLREAKVKCSQIVQEFAKDISNVVKALESLWDVQTQQLHQCSEHVEFLSQVTYCLY